jgi:hypothetical protein
VSKIYVVEKCFIQRLTEVLTEAKRVTFLAIVLFVGRTLWAKLKQEFLPQHLMIFCLLRNVGICLPLIFKFFFGYDLFQRITTNVQSSQRGISLCDLKFAQEK